MAHGRILELLKESTAACHAAVERRFDLENRLRDRGAYTALLGALYGFYRPLESALARVTGYETVGLSFAERCKSPLLARDLGALGHPVEGAGDPPEVRSLGDALGRMYVLEGATLGGRVISNMVRTRLGFTADCGCAFFASYGDRVGEMWGAFRSALVRFATTESAEREVLVAAADTFARLEAWLPPSGGAP